MQEQKSPKIRRQGTIGQFCRVISSQRRHVSTIGKKLVKQQYLLHMFFSQYGELRRISGWDLLARLGAPQLISTGFASWQRFFTARHSGSGRQPNFAASNRRRHLYSEGRPSRWALAHILVVYDMSLVQNNHWNLLLLVLFGDFLKYFTTGTARSHVAAVCDKQGAVRTVYPEPLCYRPGRRGKETKGEWMFGTIQEGSEWDNVTSLSAQTCHFEDPGNRRAKAR